MSASVAEPEAITTRSKTGKNGGLQAPKWREWNTKTFWFGDYDYKAMFMPRIPYLTAERYKDVETPFYAPNEALPIVLSVILGLQHALAMVGGLITPPILLGSAAALDSATQEYLISASLIFCGIGTALQVSRFRLPFGYTIGSGVLTVIGTSFSFVAVGLTYMPTEFKADGTGMCKLDADGNKLPCPELYGAFLGTAAVVGIFAIAVSFVSPRIIKRLFPPLISGIVLLCIGCALMSSAVKNWAGGSGSCYYDRTMLCPSPTAPQAHLWGSAPLIGLGFLVFISIILFDLLGPPFVKNASVFLGLLMGLIVSAACGYFEGSTIRNAPTATFLWVRTFPLSIKGSLVLPFLAAYLVIISETIGNVTATSEVSGLEISGPDFSSRVQGGLLSDTICACLAPLATVPPLTTFSQNISVVALTRNASRQSGYVCAFFLLLMGVFSKFGAVFVAMPASVLGGMTTFLFASVAVAGIRILAMVKWSRRTRFIATVSLALGYASITVPDWFSSFFTYSGPNASLTGFLNALTLIVEESYLIAMLVAVPMNLLIPYGPEDVDQTEAGEIVLPVTANELAAERGSSEIKKADE